MKYCLYTVIIIVAMSLTDGLPFDPEQFPSVGVKVKVWEIYHKHKKDTAKRNALKRTRKEFIDANIDCSGWMNNNNKCKGDFVTRCINKGWPPAPAAKELRAFKRRKIVSELSTSGDITKASKLISKYTTINGDKRKKRIKKRNCRDKRIRSGYQYCRRMSKKYHPVVEEEDIDININHNNHNHREHLNGNSDDNVGNDKEELSDDSEDDDIKEESPKVETHDWLRWSARCPICEGLMDATWWPVECMDKECKLEAHYCCLCMDVRNPDKLYCSDCWMNRCGNNDPPSEIEESEYVRCVGIDKIYGVKYYLFGYDDNEDIQYNYYKTGGQFATFLSEEKEAINDWETKWKNITNRYNIQYYDERDEKIGNNRTVTVQRYSMGDNVAPLITINSFVTAKDGDAIATVGDDLFKRRKWWKKEYHNSIQESTQRVKAHCRLFYGTTLQDKRLTSCALRWTDLFTTKRQRRIVKQAIKDIYTILKSEYVEDIEWLNSRKIGEGKMVLLLAKYNGGGIAAHRDDYFEGPVIVIIVKNRGRGGCEREGRKYASLGMKSYSVVNKRATIENPEYSCYAFWSWLTRYGVHGVPRQKGNDSIVLIIRKDRFYYTRR